MATPRDPHDFDDDMLLRQIRRRLPRHDVRGRDLLHEAQARLWGRHFELNELHKTMAGMYDEITSISEGISQANELLGIPKPRPTLRLIGGEKK